jgi:MFS family permease
MLITINAWASSFFIRVHHLTLVEVGLILGIGGSVLSFFANPFWGWFAGKMAERSRHWPLTIVAINCLLITCTAAIMLFTPYVIVSIACSVAGTLLIGGYAPMTYTVLMDETPERMRGTVMSILQLGSSALGFIVGPWMIGILSDRFGGGTAIRYALANSLVLYVVAAFFIWLAAFLLFARRRGQMAT